MKNKILLFSLVMIAEMSVSVWAADISGEWKVEMSRQDRTITRTWYEFKVEGSKLTGSAIGYMEDERPILDGTVKNNSVFFTLKEYVGTRVFEYRYQGKVSGDTIKFQVYRVGAGPRYWKFTVKKVSP